MHRLSSAFVLGFHGCDKSVGEKLLAGDKFKLSENVYDWLGAGMYFWESNPRRGMEWAIIDLGFCLDLMTSDAAKKLKAAHDSLVVTYTESKQPLPENKGLQPELDCAVINWLHYIRKKDGREAFQSVKGVFIEGDPIYPTANFKKKTHTSTGKVWLAYVQSSGSWAIIWTKRRQTQKGPANAGPFCWRMRRNATWSLL